MKPQKKVLPTASAAEQHKNKKQTLKRRSRGHGAVKACSDDDAAGNDDGPLVEREAYTIPEFCRAHRLSEALYFKMKKQGLGPREMHAFTRVMISVEAAREWRKAREQEA